MFLVAVTSVISDNTVIDGNFLGSVVIGWFTMQVSPAALQEFRDSIRGDETTISSLNPSVKSGVGICSTNLLVEA